MIRQKSFSHTKVQDVVTNSRGLSKPNRTAAAIGEVAVKIGPTGVQGVAVIEGPGGSCTTATRLSQGPIQRMLYQ